MADDVGPQHGRGERGGRPAWVLPVAIGAAVVVVAGIVVGVVLSRSDEVAAPPATAPAPVVTTIVLPVPTPDVAPSTRATTTDFTALLPASVLQFAYASSQPATDWQAAGALEASADTYTDGGTGKLTVQAGQFPTADAATAFAATLVAALPSAAPSTTPSTAPSAAPSTAPGPAPSTGPSPAATGASALPRTGSVVVSGATTGSYTIVDGGDGTGVAVWTNGTAVFRMVAPLADVINAYGAYPL
ncbi:MAG TPA: hypothetical protein VGC04_10775 [Cellulomonas sp.]